MGRRAYQRFAVVPTSEGVVRVLRDIVVQQASEGELVVISNEPGVVDSTLAVELHNRQAEDARTLSVRVAESQPVVVSGSVCHRLVLHVVNGMPAHASHAEHQREPRWDSERL